MTGYAVGHRVRRDYRWAKRARRYKRTPAFKKLWYSIKDVVDQFRGDKKHYHLFRHHVLLGRLRNGKRAI